jgi:hypothetical protein
MIEDRVIELMNGEIDGINSQRDSEWLREYLAGDEEARAYFEELRDSIAVLERAGPVEPPPELRGRLLAALADAPAPVAGGHRTRLRFLRDAFAFRRQPSHALAFGAGAVLAAIVLLALGLPLGPERSQLSSYYGVALDRQGEAPVAVLTTEGVRCEIDARRHERNVLLWVRLASDRSILAVLEAEGPARCEGILAPEAPDTDQIRMSGSRVELAHSGVGRYQVSYHEMEGVPLSYRIELYAEGAVIAEQSFTARRE